MYLNRGKEKAAESVPSVLRKQLVDVKRLPATDTNDQSRWSSRTMWGDVDKKIWSWYIRS
jgi:hypothetical protein